jgi:hypothetical protein
VRHRIIVNLILIGAVIVLAVFLMNTGTQPGNPVIPLTSIAPQSIQRIDIKRAGRQDLGFRKIHGVWRMTKPLEVRANDNRINAMLQLLQAPSVSRLRARDHDLSRFELAPAAVVLREDAHEFLFGGTSPLQGRRYILSDDTIHLIQDGLYPQLLQGPAFFVSTRLIPEATLLREISLPGYRLIYIDNTWQARAAPDLDGAALERLAADWLSASAVSIGDLDAAPAMGEVRITARNGAIMRFEILQREPLLKLARTDLGITYTLPAGAAESLLLK